MDDRVVEVTADDASEELGTVEDVVEELKLLDGAGVELVGGVYAISVVCATVDGATVAIGLPLGSLNVSPGATETIVEGLSGIIAVAPVSAALTELASGATLWLAVVGDAAVPAGFEGIDCCELEDEMRELREVEERDEEVEMVLFENLAWLSRCGQRILEGR